MFHRLLESLLDRRFGNVVAVGDVVEVTASPTDPAQIGRKFRVAGLFRKTLATAQRLSVEEVTA